MSWMGLANVVEKDYSPLLMNEFYFGILIHADAYENLVKFRYDVLNMFFDGKNHLLNERNLGKLLGCEHYTSPHETPDHYPVDNV